ncbi:MAG: glycerol-3-phosphate dehydrogenase/oxidase [Phormidesmis sp.]
MHRDLVALSNQVFDLLVIGGGMYGACVAWEAILRGLSVALVEQSDFASGTSANSLKVIHGGLRYLQTADFPRMRQSIKERQTLMRIAPHLVHPMPVLVPTYGHSLKGKEAMMVALKMNDMISGDRNLPLSDPQKHIPPGELVSKSDCLQLLPDLPTQNLTGAARFYDAQVYNSEQLVLSFIQSAAQRGAQIANYVRVVDFKSQHSRVTGAFAEDALTGDRFEIQSKNIINASGPWVDQLIARAKGTVAPQQKLAKAMNLVTRPLFGARQDCAVGITGRAPGSRLFFIAPWRGRSLVGTWYGPDNEAIKPPKATSAEIAHFLTEINQSYPTFDLTIDDVAWVHAGLLPSDGISAKSGDMKLAKHFELIDHKQDDFAGLLSVKGVKYTTARDVARRAVNWVFRDRGQMPEKSCSHAEPIYGGHIDRFTPFMAAAISRHAGKVSAKDITRLVKTYGSEYLAVLKYLTPSTLPASNSTHDMHPAPDILAAEVRYHIANTMPQTLSDIVFRRTELGSAGRPSDEALDLCAQIMSERLGWSPEKQRLEIAQVKLRYEDLSQPSETIASASTPCPA